MVGGHTFSNLLKSWTGLKKVHSMHSISCVSHQVPTGCQVPAGYYTTKPECIKSWLTTTQSGRRHTHCSSSPSFLSVCKPTTIHMQCSLARSLMNRFAARSLSLAPPEGAQPPLHTACSCFQCGCRSVATGTTSMACPCLISLPSMTPLQVSVDDKSTHCPYKRSTAVLLQEATPPEQHLYHPGVVSRTTLHAGCHEAPCSQIDNTMLPSMLAVTGRNPV